MKKVVFCIVLMLLTVSLGACGGSAKKPNLYIEKAQLTEQEKAIAELLGANQDQRLFDFKLDDTVQSVQINTYELQDGAWTLVSGGGGSAFTDEKGRLALGFENLALGLRVALQSAQNSGSTTYSTEPADESSWMGRATSGLDNLTEIVYEKEIPLVIQISTTQDSIRSFDVDYFFTPAEYEKYGYEHVYAITIRFSQKTVDEQEPAA